MILDIIFFVFIVGFAALGFVFGFFKTLVSFFGWFISLLMAYLLAKSIANAFLSANMANWLIGNGSLFDKVYGIVPDGLKEISMEEIRKAVNSGADMDAIKEVIRDQSKGLLFFASSLIQAAVTKEIYLNSAIENVGQVFALELTYHIYVIIVGIIFFIALRVVVMCISILFRSKIKDHEPKSWERFAGIALGAVRGFAYACILLMVASYIAGLSGTVKNQVDNSKVSVPVTTWISQSTSKILSDNLEENKHYLLMIDALDDRIEAGNFEIS